MGNTLLYTTHNVDLLYEAVKHYFNLFNLTHNRSFLY